MLTNTAPAPAPVADAPRVTVTVNGLGAAALAALNGGRYHSCPPRTGILHAVLPATFARFHAGTQEGAFESIDTVTNGGRFVQVSGTKRQWSIFLHRVKCYANNADLRRQDKSLSDAARRIEYDVKALIKFYYLQGLDALITRERCLNALHSNVCAARQYLHDYSNGRKLQAEELTYCADAALQYRHGAPAEVTEVRAAISMACAIARTAEKADTDAEKAGYMAVALRDLQAALDTVTAALAQVDASIRGLHR